MTRYRLYTERFDNLATITSNYFEGFTLFESQGYWQGVAEQSVVIEIIASDDDSWRIDALAEFIRRANNQQAVIVTTEPVHFKMIAAEVA